MSHPPSDLRPPAPSPRPGGPTPAKRYAAYEHIQVLGAVLSIVTSGLGSFWPLANRIMLEENLGTMGPNGLVQFDPDAWYSLASNLRVLDRLRRDLGDVILRQMGNALPRLAQLAQPAGNIRSALQDVDLAYHQHHAVNGRRMVHEETGQFQEGIGHYRMRIVPHQKQVVSECSSAYPCLFDQALLLTLAQTYEPTASLTHLEPAHCRAHGAAHCGYAIVWQ